MGHQVEVGGSFVAVHACRQWYRALYVGRAAESLDPCPAVAKAPGEHGASFTVHSACFPCGIGAGLIVTGVLNPWDRALYLSVINRTSFFTWEHWRRPYRGISQTLVQRTLSSGLYFPLEEMFAEATGSSIAGGQLAGVTSGAVLNPLSLIKYQSWGATQVHSFRATALSLYAHAGPLVFFRGIMSTVFRDATFGFFFALRKKFNIENEDHIRGFLVGGFCAAVGTAVSSPFNYLRNLSYAAKPTTDMETLRSKRQFTEVTFRELADEVRAQGTRLGGWRVVQARMRLGWGTARVAVGMALTDQLYRAGCAAFAGVPA